MGPCTILIDGYNVIRNTPGLRAAERVGLQEGRQALLAQVAARYQHMSHTVIVVFDGDGATETMRALVRGVRGQIVFTRRGESADSVIGRIAAEQRARGAAVMVVSDDFEVRGSVSATGGQAAHVADWMLQLNAPSKDQQRMARHRARMRRELERDE